jgi:hypothetical protein
MMKSKLSALSFFDSIPDDVLVNIAVNDWEALERLCMALTLDIQIIKEEIESSYEDTSNRRNVC